jgi:hypothetical protein
VGITSGTTTLAPDQEGEFSIACQPGQKVLGGGFSSDGSVFNLDSYPASDTQWRIYLANGSTTAPANVTMYVTCIR